MSARGETHDRQRARIDRPACGVRTDDTHRAARPAAARPRLAATLRTETCSRARTPCVRARSRAARTAPPRALPTRTDSRRPGGRARPGRWAAARGRCLWFVLLIELSRGEQ